MNIKFSKQTEFALIFVILFLIVIVAISLNQKNSRPQEVLNKLTQLDTSEEFSIGDFKKWMWSNDKDAIDDINIGA
jgi:hypothetical protein